MPWASLHTTSNATVTAVKLDQTINVFAARPWSSLVLALLMLCLGALVLSGWIPSSPNRRYFPGHEWVLASLCGVVGLFFAHCARVGLGKQKQQQHRKEHND